MGLLVQSNHLVFVSNILCDIRQQIGRGKGGYAVDFRYIPETLNPKTLNPKPFKLQSPQTQNPKPFKTLIVCLFIIDTSFGVWRSAAVAAICSSVPCPLDPPPPLGFGKAGSRADLFCPSRGRCSSDEPWAHGAVGKVRQSPTTPKP